MALKQLLPEAEASLGNGNDGCQLLSTCGIRDALSGLSAQLPQPPREGGTVTCVFMCGREVLGNERVGPVSPRAE